MDWGLTSMSESESEPEVPYKRDKLTVSKKAYHGRRYGGQVMPAAQRVRRKRKVRGFVGSNSAVATLLGRVANSFNELP